MIEMEKGEFKESIYGKQKVFAIGACGFSGGWRGVFFGAGRGADNF